MAKTLWELMQGASPKFIPWLILAWMGAPILAGLTTASLGAFGYFPALGATDPGLNIWIETFNLPGFSKALALSLFTGLGGAISSFILALALASQIKNPPRIVNLLLASPHAAIAVALAFMIAPTGLITRFLGFDTPPQIATIHDPFGLGLMLGLIIKETPFLLLIILSAQNQINASALWQAARALGVSAKTSWLKIIIPMIYPHIRLALFVVIAFGVSVVDMAQILGPTTPPTLAILAMRHFYSPDLAKLLPASALAISIALTALLAIGFWIMGEHLIKTLTQSWRINGAHRSRLETPLTIFRLTAHLLLAFAAAALIALILWSLAWRWPFPEIIPSQWSFANWIDWRDWWPILRDTAIIGCLSTSLSLALAILWLEATPTRLEPLIYIPLILPQISFLFGLNLSYLQFDLGYSIASVIWAHSFFVFPYILIALGAPWRKLDQRFLTLAASMRQSSIRILFKVKLLLLLRPILLAAAIGFAVSVAQYLPTIFLGAGRVETLTTEAVTLSSSGDRRIIAVYAILQIILPLIGFLLALLIPAWRFQNRKAMSIRL